MLQRINTYKKQKANQSKFMLVINIDKKHTKCKKTMYSIEKFDLLCYYIIYYNGKVGQLIWKKSVFAKTTTLLFANIAKKRLSRLAIVREIIVRFASALFISI